MNQVTHTSPLLDSSLPHHDHFFRQSSCFGQVVRHQQRRDGEIVAQIVEAFLKLRSRDRVQRSEGLVQQNHTWPGGDAPRQCHALSLATGELMGETRSKLCRWKSNELERAPSGIGRVRQVLKRWYERDVAQYSPVRKEAAVLLHVSDPAT